MIITRITGYNAITRQNFGKIKKTYSIEKINEQIRNWTQARDQSRLKGQSDNQEYCQQQLDIWLNRKEQISFTSDMPK